MDIHTTPPFNREVYTEQYPVMPDENGCLPTATSYAINRLGQKTTPQEIDDIIGRVSGDLPTFEAIINLNLWLLDQRFKVENIFTPNLIDIEKYFSDGSSLTYEDYKVEVSEIYGPDVIDWFETGYTEKDYEYDMANRREKHKLFEDAEAKGDYVNSKRNLTVNDFQDLMTQGSVIARLSFGSVSNSHAVVLEAISISDDGIHVSFFNPDTDNSLVLEYVCETLDELFTLEAGIMVIRPY